MTQNREKVKHRAAEFVKVAMEDHQQFARLQEGSVLDTTGTVFLLDQAAIVTGGSLTSNDLILGDSSAFQTWVNPTQVDGWTLLLPTATLDQQSTEVCGLSSDLLSPLPRIGVCTPGAIEYR